MDSERTQRHGREIVVTVAISLGFLYLAFRGVSLPAFFASLQKVQVSWVFVAVLVSLLLMVFRAWRWQLELRPLEHIPLARLWVVTAVAYMAINLLPVRLGEVVRPWLLSRRSRVSISNAVGTIVVEKTFDSLVILFYILLGLLTVDNLPVWVRRGAIFPAVGAALLVTLVLLVYWRGEEFADRRILQLLPERFAGGLKRILSSIVDGMRILPNPGLLFAVFLVSIALWFLPILSSWIMIRAFAFDVPFSAALMVFIFVGFGSAIPNLPFGPLYWVACQLALRIFEVPPADGLAYGIVLNGVQILTIAAQGLVALWLAGLSFADLRRAGQD